MPAVVLLTVTQAHLMDTLHWVVVLVVDMMEITVQRIMADLVVEVLQLTQASVKVRQKSLVLDKEVYL